MMKHIRKFLSVLAALGIAVAPLTAGDTITLNGAGATFPYPIYSKWFDLYHEKHADVEINYQSIGSGGGIKQITAKTVDFGATDGPMTNAEIFAVDGKILHIPTVLGAVVVGYNLPTLSGKLNISGTVLANIFLGKVKSWSDASLKALNPDVNLPELPIVVVHRSDGSGTTYCFSDYLSAVSGEWKSKVGTGKSLNWPVGLGGKGNEGVAGTLKQTAGGIGYVELAYAEQNKIPYMSIRNKAGKFIVPTLEGVSAAAASVNMPADFRVSIVNADGDASYPISTFTWLLVYEKTGGKRGEILHDFLLWMLDEGQKAAPVLGYAPLPASVAAKVRETAEKVR